MLVGYARVSTLEQNLDRQIDALVSYGIDKRNIYQEKMSGKAGTTREALNRLIDELQPGDVVVICDLTRVGRSTKDLLSIVDKIKAKGASIKSLKDTWLDTSSDNPYNEFLLTIMSALSQLERDLTSHRTKEGLASAAKRGRKPGRPRKRNQKTELVEAMLDKGYPIQQIANQVGLSRTTIYRIIRDKEEKGLD